MGIQIRVMRNKKTDLIESVQFVYGNRGIVLTPVHFRTICANAKRRNEAAIWDITVPTSASWWIGQILNWVRIPYAQTTADNREQIRQVVAELMEVVWDDIAYDVVVKYADKRCSWGEQ